MSDPAPPQPAPQLLSVVVPVYGSGEALPELLRRMDAAFASWEGTALEYLLVDDDSPGPSWQRIQELAADPRVTGIQLARNYGQHSALMCGFRHARGEIVVTVDDDLQNPPEEVPKLVRALIEREHDVVYGYYGRGEHPAFRNITSQAVRSIIVRGIAGLDPHYSSFRVLRRSVVEAIGRHSQAFVYVDGLIAWVTTRTSHVVVRHDARHDGDSGYSLSKLVGHFLTIVTSFTLVPLRLVAWLGLAVFFVGLVLGLYTVAMKLAGNVPVSGFTALMVAICTFAGAQMLMLGVIGEYVGRIFLKLSEKPQYHIRSTTVPLEAAN